MVEVVIITLGLLTSAVGLVLHGVPRWEGVGWAKYLGLSAALAAAAALTADGADRPALALVGRRAELLGLALFLAAYVEHVHRALGRAAPSRPERIGAAALVLGAIVLQVPGSAFIPGPDGAWRPTVGTAAAAGVFGGLALTLVARLSRAAARGLPVGGPLFGVSALTTAAALDFWRLGTGAGGPMLLPGALVLPLLVESASFMRQVAEDSRRLGVIHERLVEDAEARSAALSDVRDDLADARRLGAVGRLAAGLVGEIGPALAVARDNVRHILDRAAPRTPTQGQGMGPGASATARPAGYDDAEDTRLALEDAVGAIDRIAGVVHQLELAAEAARGRREDPVPLHVRDVVGAALRELPIGATERLTLDVLIDPELLVRAPARGLTQVLAALLRQSLRSLQDRPDGGGTLTIRAPEPGSRPGDRVEILVADDGPGMGRAALGDDDGFAGTGGFGAPHALGRTMARELLRGMDGGLVFAPGAGEGTIARVTLPRAAPGPVSAAERRVVDDTAPRSTSRSLLLVDDDELVRRALARRLGKHWHVEPVATVDDAARRLARAPAPAVVLCDVMMEAGGGPGLYETIRQRAPALAARFVFLTGGATDRRAREFLDRQPQPVLRKPLDVGVLEQAYLDVARTVPPTAPATKAAS